MSIQRVNGDIIVVEVNSIMQSEDQTTLYHDANISYSVDMDERYPDINNDVVQINKPRVVQYEIQVNINNIKEKKFKITWSELYLKRCGFKGNYRILLEKLYSKKISKEQMVQMATEIIENQVQEDHSEIPDEQMEIKVGNHYKLPQKITTQSILSIMSIDPHIDKIKIPKQSIPSIQSMSEEENKSNPEDLDIIVNYSQFQCSICFIEKHIYERIIIEQCKHICCSSCFTDYLESLIKSSQVIEIKCFHEECNSHVAEQQILQALPTQSIQKYNKFKRRFILQSDPNVKFCIRPDCEQYVRKADNNSSNLLKCTCGMEFCFRCNAPWHAHQTCEQVIDKEFKQYAKKNLIQKCPQCKSLVEKKEGCNHITCSVCKYQWCWLCRGKYSSKHFSRTNPFGCPGYFQDKAKWPKSKIYCLRVYLIIMMIIKILFFPLIIYMQFALIFPKNEIKKHFNLNKILRLMLFLIYVLIGMILAPFYIIAKVYNKFKNRNQPQMSAPVILGPRIALLNVRINRDHDNLRNAVIRGDDDVPDIQ